MPLNLAPFISDSDTGFAYPVSGTIFFGADYAHSEFVVPMARFEFYDQYGSSRAAGAPIIYMRMNGQFQTGLSNQYNETANIFGNPSGDDKDVFNVPTALLKGGISALYKQVGAAASSAAGYMASAGANGKAQYEFLTRKVLNTFQQLVYQGPTFRRYTLPFTMKPTSLEEAQAMINIIKTFRIASVAKGNNFEDKIDTAKRAASGAGTPAEDKDVIDAGLLQGVADALAATSITFTYPDMCSFEILVTQNKIDGLNVTSLFESEFCVIESVNIDYGSQNKMLFFESLTTATSGEPIYYPAEVTLTISLKETTLPLSNQIYNENSVSTRTIF